MEEILVHLASPDMQLDAVSVPFPSLTRLTPPTLPRDGRDAKLFPKKLPDPNVPSVTPPPRVPLGNRQQRSQHKSLSSDIRCPSASQRFMGALGPKIWSVPAVHWEGWNPWFWEMTLRNIRGRGLQHPNLKFSPFVIGTLLLNRNLWCASPADGAHVPSAHVLAAGLH